jgi:hypothetical protein
MVRRFTALGLAAGLAVASAAAPAHAASAPPHVLFQISDPRLTEASGIAAGIRSPGVLYAQNDSGDTARFFALDKRTGRVVAEIRVPGATNVDWEDLAVARDRRGVPSVWIADIGDNAKNRAQVQLYRVDEPQVSAAGYRTIVTARPEVWRLQYPSGHPDAESLAVAPGGRAFLVTKNLTGSSKMYEVPARPASGVQRLQPVGTVQFSLTGTTGGPAGPVGNLTATGAALSADGRTLVIRTYTDAWFWPVPSSGVAAALRSRPVHIALPRQPQGEGIAFVGDRVVVDSERVGSKVWSVPVPYLHRAAAPASVPKSASSAAMPPTHGSPAGTTSAASFPRSSASGAPLYAVLGAGVALGVGGLMWLLRRHQRP